MEEYTLMEVFAAYFGEILVGTVLMVFGFAFQSWAKSLRSSTERAENTALRILAKLEGLVIEFHNHRVDIENRVTRVETKVDIDRLERHQSRHPEDHHPN